MHFDLERVFSPTSLAEFQQWVRDIIVRCSVIHPLSRPQFTVNGMTPEMATWLLEFNPESNRKQRIKWIESMTRVIENGGWWTTHEGIAFFAGGTIADGQHRLEALAYSDLPIDIVITFNVPDEAKDAINQAKPWNGSDVFRRSGISDGNHLTAAVRLLMSIEAGLDYTYTYPVHEVTDWVKRNPEVLELVTHGHSLGTALQLPGRGLTAAFYLLRKSDPTGPLSEFIETLKSGLDVAGRGLDAEDPLRVFRELARNPKKPLIRIMREFSFSKQGHVVVAFVVKAWNFWRIGRSIVGPKAFRNVGKIDEIRVPATVRSIRRTG